MANKRRWTSAKKLQKAVDDYFEDCKGKGRIPSVTELALALGFTCRQALDRYTDRETDGEPDDPMVGIITRAKSRIEVENIQAAYLRDSSAGARFVLENGFGYSRKNEVDMTGGVINVEVK